MKKALLAGALSFLVIGVGASIVEAQRTARRLDPTAFQLGGWAADEALWFDPFQLTTLRPETTVLAPRLASTGSSSPVITAAPSTKAAPGTAAALTSPLTTLSSPPPAPTSPATTVLPTGPEPDQTLSGAESALAALSSTESPTSPTTTTALSESPEPDQTLSGSGDSLVPLSARPPIRIPYRPVLRSPFRPPLL